MLEVKTEPIHKVEREETTIEEMGTYVVDWLRVHGKTSFKDVIGRMKSKIRVVTTFLAVLELIREQVLILFEDASAEEFYLEYNSNHAAHTS